MVSAHNIKPNELIKKASTALEDSVKAPEWTKFVKTGHGKKVPPYQKNWYQTRAASILRKIYMHGPIGTSKLRKVYSHKKNRGHKPERTTIASGKIIRTAIQQLEKAGLVQQTEKGVHKGRVVTPKGKSFLDKLSK
jgi:small subunit ribosomal protein S19e